MGFWFFMLIMDLLLPLMMIGFGRYFSKSAPKEINYVFGYRTSMSMKNKDTWSFAHTYCGNFWFKSGFVMLVITIIVLLFFIGETEDTIGKAGGIICGIQLLSMFVSILLTEIALHKTFDKSGKRKEVVNEK